MQLHIKWVGYRCLYKFVMALLLRKQEIIWIVCIYLYVWYTKSSSIWWNFEFITVIPKYIHTAHKIILKKNEERIYLSSSQHIRKLQNLKEKKDHFIYSKVLYAILRFAYTTKYIFIFSFLFLFLIEIDKVQYISNNIKT